jgi:2-methylcitrate dehydratase PrpD
MITRLLADFVSNLRYKDLPNEVVRYTKLLLLDQLGCAIAAYGFPEVRILLEVFVQPTNECKATIWGYGLKTSPQLAALINSASGHALLLSDTHRRAKLHPGVVIIPSALAVGEWKKCSGGDLLSAIVAGYEVMIRIGMALDPLSHRKRGFWATGTCGPFGSAVAASKILNLEQHKIAEAMGLAGTKPAGLWAFKHEGLASTFLLDCGIAAFNGIVGAMLAASGFRGPSMILESDDGGFLRALSDNPLIEKSLEGLGEVFQITKVGIKPYACSRGIHGPIDATLKLLKENNITPSRIKRITVHTNTIAMLQYNNIRPETRTAAQLSLPFCIALAITDETKLFTMKLSDRDLNNEEVLKLARLVEMKVDPSIDSLYPDKWACRVEIWTNDGSKYTQYLLHPKGEPENPMSQQEVESKFKKLVSDVIGERNAARIIDYIRGIENQSNITELIELTTVAKSSSTV